MVYVPEGLEPLMVRDPDGARQADASEIVAKQIDDHGQFGVVFGAFQEVPDQLAVFFHRGAAPAGSLDGSGFQVITSPVQESFHGSGKHLVISCVNEGIERGRVQFKKRYPEFESIPAERKVVALGEIDLVGVSIQDVSADLSHRIEIFVPAEIAAECSRAHVRGHECGRLFKKSDRRQRLLSRGQPQKGQLSFQSVMHEDAFGPEEKNVGEVQVVGSRLEGVQPGS